MTIESTVRALSSVRIIGLKPELTTSKGQSKVRDYRQIFPLIKVPGDVVREKSLVSRQLGRF